MKKLNQSGKATTVIIIMIAVLLLFIVIVAYIFSQRHEVVKVGVSKQVHSTNTRNVSVEPPENWQEYTNPDNEYTLNFPAGWGSVVQTEPVAGHFEYRFTSREEVVLRQLTDSESGVEFTDDHSIFNQYRESLNEIFFCTNQACDKRLVFADEDVRLLLNQNARNGVEIFVPEANELRLIAIVNTSHKNYPGLNIEVLVDEQSPAGTIEEKTIKANEKRFSFFTELREFIDYVR